MVGTAASTTRKYRPALPPLPSDSEMDLDSDSAVNLKTLAPKPAASKGKGKAPMKASDAESAVITDEEGNDQEEVQDGEDLNEDEKEEDTDLRGFVGQAAVDALMRSVPKPVNATMTDSTVSNLVE